MMEWIISSSLLILVVLVLRAALGKRISAGLRYGLWAVVLVRLLLPVSFVAVTVPQLPVWEPPEAMLEKSIYVLPVDSAPAGEAGIAAWADGSIMETASFGHSRLDDSGKKVVRYADRISPLELLGWVWIAGAAALGAALAASNLRFIIRLRRVRRPLEGTSAPIPVYVAAGLPSPCLIGLLHPAIYVTEEAADTPAMLRHVLAHELTHYNHLDHLWSVLRGAALAVHWWNPLVWLAVVCSRRDGELACDEGALERLGDGERTAYGETLLALVTAKSRPGDLLSFATTMTGGKRSLKERIQRIACRPKRLVSAMVVVVAVLVLSSVVAFGQAKEKEKEVSPLLQPLDLCWNDSMETVIAKLGITEEQILYNESDEFSDPNTSEQWSLAVKDVPFLGYNATVSFDFIHYAGTAGGYGLNKVTAIFPEDADMAAVKAELIEQYGEGEKIDPNYAYLKLLPDLPAPQPDGENHHMYWKADCAALPEGYEDRVRDWLLNVRYKSVDLEKIENYLSEALIATLHWTDDWLLVTDILTTNRVSFDATLFVEFLQNVPLDETEPVSTHVRPYDVNRDGVQEESGGQAADLPVIVDLDHDGAADTLTVRQTGEGVLGAWTLQYTASGMSTPAWEGEAYTAHVGWTAFFLCRQGGEDYLLQYTPWMGGGSCQYNYKLFYLTTGGEEVVVQENSVEFDLIFHPDYVVQHQYNPWAINTFMEEINALLESSEQLLNTDENLLGTFEKEGRLYDSVWWMDDVRDENRTLLENLILYQDKALEEASGQAADLPVTVDLDHDGRPDEMALRIGKDPLGFSYNGTMWTLECELSGGGAWETEGRPSLPGCNAVFLYQMDGEDYLLLYVPEFWHGMGSYEYRLFYLDGGREVVVQENTVTFDVKFHEDSVYDPEEIAAFMEEINALLAGSTQLVNTNRYLLETFASHGRLYDDLYWLDDWREDGLSLLEVLQNYGTYGGDHPDDAWSPLADLLQDLTEADILAFNGDQSALVDLLKGAERGSRFYTWESYEGAYDGHGVDDYNAGQWEVSMADGSTLYLIASSQSGNVLIILEASSETVSASYSAPELNELIRSEAESNTAGD